MIKTITILLFLILLAGTASATQYYVSPIGTGNGLSISNPGDISTLERSLVAGDIMCFLPGTYSITGGSFVILNSGTAANPITLTNINNGVVTLLGTGSGYGFTGRGSYIIVSNLTFDYYGDGIVIEPSAQYDNPLTGDKVLNCSIKNCGGDAISIGGYVNNSVIEGCTIVNCPYNSIMIYGTNSPYYNGWNVDLATQTPRDNHYTHDITVSNTSITGPYTHSAIDLFGELVNITLNNVTVVQDAGGLGSIYFHTSPSGHVLAENLSILNSTIYGYRSNGGDGIKVGCNNSTFYGNKILNISNNGILFYLDSHNLNLSDNYIIDHYTGFGIFGYIYNAYCTRNNVICPQGSNVVDYRLDNGNNFIIDPLGSSFGIAGNYANNWLVFTNGKLFTEDNAGSPIWTPTGSKYNLHDGMGFTHITTYPLYIMPTSSNVTVSSIDSFNTSLPIGSTIMSITISSTNGNNVNFVLSNLHPNGTYIVGRDGVNISTQLADSTGKITWSNSNWSTAHKFTIVESASPVVGSYYTDLYLFANHYGNNSKDPGFNPYSDVDLV